MKKIKTVKCVQWSRIGFDWEFKLQACFFSQSSSFHLGFYFVNLEYTMLLPSLHHLGQLHQALINSTNLHQSPLHYNFVT